MGRRLTLTSFTGRSHTGSIGAVGMRYLLLCLLVMTGATLAPAASILSPTGAGYLSVTANAQYSSSFGPQNLFNIDVTGLQSGSSTGSSSDWAVTGTGPGYVEFELDDVYEVASLFYAQRVGAVPHPGQSGPH